MGSPMSLGRGGGRYSEGQSGKYLCQVNCEYTTVVPSHATAHSLPTASTEQHLYNMRQLTVIGALALCSLAVIVETKPFLAVKVVPVPVLVPKINILGLVGKALHAKAALVGKVVHAKAALIGKVLGAKATLVGHILGSSSSPVIGAVHPAPLFPEPIYPSAPPPYSPPPSSYGTPPS